MVMPADSSYDDSPSVVMVNLNDFESSEFDEFIVLSEFDVFVLSEFCTFGAVSAGVRDPGSSLD